MHVQVVVFPVDAYGSIHCLHWLVRGLTTHILLLASWDFLNDFFWAGGMRTSVHCTLVALPSSRVDSPL